MALGSLCPGASTPDAHQPHCYLSAPHLPLARVPRDPARPPSQGEAPPPTTATAPHPLPRPCSLCPFFLAVSFLLSKTIFSHIYVVYLTFYLLFVARQLHKGLSGLPT